MPKYSCDTRAAGSSVCTATTDVVRERLVAGRLPEDVTRWLLKIICYILGFGMHQLLLLCRVPTCKRRGAYRRRMASRSWTSGITKRKKDEHTDNDSGPMPFSQE